VGIREANRFSSHPRYTLPMNLILDPATKQRIQREIAIRLSSSPGAIVATD